MMRAFWVFYYRKCMNPMTTILIHSVNVLIMNGIIRKINDFTFCWRPPKTPPKDPTLKTTELLCSRQCLSEILIICPRLSVVSKSSSQISTVILWDFSKLMSHIKYFKRTTRGCNAVLHCVSATLFIVQWIIRLVALREYKVTDKCVAIEHWLLHFPFTSWSGVVSQWIQS